MTLKSLYLNLIFVLLCASLSSFADDNSNEPDASQPSTATPLVRSGEWQHDFPQEQRPRSAKLPPPCPLALVRAELQAASGTGGDGRP